MHRRIIDRLHTLNPDTVKLGLENISKLLNSLGNPQTNLNTIHIAGTNGKGSTAFFLNSIFKTAGYKTGLYMSPHLIDIRERMTIGSTRISEKKFSELAEHIFSIMEKEKLSATFFEFITALAFLYFFQEKIDLGIIEVGLGGRLDATNVLNPLVSIITEIGIEHTQHLGPSIKEIAREKGGIIKPGVTVFVSTENNEAIASIKNISHKQNATCFQYGKDFLAENSGKMSIPQNFSFKFRGRVIKELCVQAAGSCQIKNSSTAIAAALYLSTSYRAINDNSICKGIRDTKLPCRMELVGESPQIVMDAGHNYQALQALIKDIPLFFTYKKLIVLLGILKDKEHKQIIQSLSSRADFFIMAEPKTDRALSAHLLEKEALAFHTTTYVEKEIPKALRKAKEIANPQDLILITGSFYTVGEALSEMEKQN